MTPPRENVPEGPRRKILEHLNTRGEQTARQLLEALGMGRSRLANYLKLMKTNGDIVVREELGKTHPVVLYRATAQAAKLDVESHPLLKQFRILGRETYSSDRCSNPNAGGQGAAPVYRGVASSANWI